MAGKWEFWGHPLFGAGWRQRKTTPQDDADVDRLEREALPTQPARRIRRLRSAKAQLPFLGVVTNCSRDAAGTTTITGKKLTARPYEFQDGEEFAAFAGTDPALIVDSMVLVWPLVPPADDRNMTHFAMPHFSVNPMHLQEPADPDCMAYFDLYWDNYIDPSGGDPYALPSDLCEVNP